MSQESLKRSVSLVRFCHCRLPTTEVSLYVNITCCREKKLVARWINLLNFDFLPVDRVHGLSFSSEQQPNQAAETSRTFLYYGQGKPHKSLLQNVTSLCVFNYSLIGQKVPANDAAWRHIGANYGKLRRTLSEALFLELNAFFLWLKHYLSDLPLTWLLYGPVGLKDVWLNMQLCI